MRRLLRFLCVALALALGASSSFGLSKALKAILFAPVAVAGGGGGAIAWVSTGTAVTGNETILVAYPTVSAGDGLLMVHTSRGSGDPSTTTPTDWTLIGTANGGSGSYGADSGNGRVTIFWKVATGSESGNVTVTTTGASTARSQILKYSKTNSTWATPVMDSGTDTTVGTSWSVTGAGLGLEVNDMVVMASCTNGDGASYTSHAISESGATFGTVTERADHAVAVGDQHGAIIADAVVTAGSVSAAPTYTATASATSGSTPAGATAFVRLRDVP